MQIPNTNEAYTYLDVSDKVKIKFAFFSHAMKVWPFLAKLILSSLAKIHYG